MATAPMGPCYRAGRRLDVLIELGILHGLRCKAWDAADLIHITETFCHQQKRTWFDYACNPAAAD